MKYLDTRYFPKTLGEILNMNTENLIVNDYEYSEDEKIELFFIANCRISLNIVAEYKDEKYNILYGKNIIGTFLKFINNEIQLENKFFKDLDVPTRRSLLTCNTTMYIITDNKDVNTQENIDMLINNLNKIIQNIILVELKKTVPNADILISGPPDHRKKKDGTLFVNPSLNRVRSGLKEIANKHKASYWDLFEAMGGEGCIERWAEFELVNKDYMHYRKAGYEKQGKLLYDALEKSLLIPQINFRIQVCFIFT